MFVGGGKAIFILYVRVFCPFTAIVRQPIYYQLKTFSFSADKMRSIRKLPELCLFLYFGTIHYTAVSASFDSPWSIWWFAWQPLIRDVRDVSDRQGPVVPWQGVQVGAPCKYLSTTWISQRHTGWTCQPGSKTTAGTPPSALPPLTHRGTKCWRISGIRWGVCFIAEAKQGVPKKVPDRFQELAWQVSARSNNHFYHRAGLHKL